MKNLSKNLAALFAVALLFGGCNNKPQVTVIEEVEEQPEALREITFHTFSAADSNNAYTIHYDLELPDEDLDNPAVENIRANLLGIFNASRHSDPQAVINRLLQQKKVEFTEMSNELADDDIYGEYAPHLVEMTSVTHLSHNKYFMTYVVSSYGYYGGAHGGAGIEYTIFDMATGKEIAENDFITNKSAITSLLRTTALREYMKEVPDFEIFDKDNITANGNFFITPDSLIYQYGQYEIAAYCYGTPTFRLSKKDVKPYINPESAVYKYWFGE